MTTVRGPFDRLRRGADALGRNPQRPAEVTGGYGTVPASEIDTSAQPAAGRKLSPREAERLMLAELMASVQQLVLSTTELAGRLGGRQGAVNGVLGVRLVTLDAAGHWGYAGQVAIGSASVDNHATAAPVYVSSGSSATGPGAGVGVQLVPAAQRRPVPIDAHALDIWGTPGEQVSVVLFAGLQAFGVGL